MSKVSDDYHDYVFKDGKLLGQFDDMYRHSREVPWHQDKTANQVFVDLDIAILKHFLPELGIRSICDLGCGLGYVAARLYAELSPLVAGLDVTGIDVSSEAAARARLLHPQLSFHGIDILRDDISPWQGRFDLLYVKDVLWYVALDAGQFFDRARELLKPGGAIYMLQSVPDRPSFVGSDIFPTTFSIAEFLSKDFESIYVSSTYEINSNRVVGNYEKDKYLRFLGRKASH
ncbi:class I SAM-dependent methyltransferase [Sulfuritalea hydrogenivorans]|uniref:Methyltransferase family protein n=1 Tax=Sulfuritalea hydrogenivorans sk43H TaxID=1223802 RepID=W0SK00_9PROT|nr:class I SAM-dependent methyltransferase [Sulfuritalea hydrogenivorans]BAO31141.1 methyltransferase family protein [Sulfuritalea hydrogenivorans sk43H]